MIAENGLRLDLDQTPQDTFRVRALVDQVTSGQEDVYARYKRQLGQEAVERLETTLDVSDEDSA